MLKTYKIIFVHDWAVGIKIIDKNLYTNWSHGINPQKITQVIKRVIFFLKIEFGIKWGVDSTLNKYSYKVLFNANTNSWYYLNKHN